MIDAQHAGDAHVMAHARDEVAIAIAAQRDRRQRRQAPVLTAEEQRVGRRAGGEVEQEQVAPAPDLVGVAAHADRQIEVELRAPPRERLELALHRPLRDDVSCRPRCIGAERDRSRRGRERTARHRDRRPATCASRCARARRSRETRRSRTRRLRCAHASIAAARAGSASSRAANASIAGRRHAYCAR